jgi:murein DD-endopeptidase MepM/ murein hydrolase activator NlpD
LTVALPAGGVALPASAVAEGELPPAPDPVPVPAPAATPAPALAPIAGLPTLPGPPAPAGVDASPAAVAQQAVPAPTVAAAAAALAAPAAAVAAALRPLRMGAVGADVRELQRALRRRGVRIAIDGAYGRGTRAAVARVQRKMARRATGVADVALLKALGVAPQAPAADLGVKSAAVTDVTGAAIAGLGLPEGAPPAPVSAEALGAHFLRTFPIAGPHAYSDDFGAPRPQGAHQGVDILSPLGTPVVAVAAGAVERLSRSESGRGGITIWMRDTAGNVFFYAHLASIADGLQDGTPVAIGQQIGTVGNTGDARGGPTHLHFELHPGGNGAVDPFNELTTVDPDKAVQTPASLTPRRPARAR